MSLGVKCFALFSSVIAICVFVGKFYLFSANEVSDFNDQDNGVYLRHESWAASSFGNASKFTRLFLFSRNLKKNFSQLIYKNVSCLLSSGFDPTKTTKLLIHGWMDNIFINFAVEVRDAYLAAQNTNVVAVDWSRVAGLVYPLTRVAVEPVGIYLAQFVDWLVSEGIPISSIHIIGHSLGAHIAGVVGEHVTSGRISRITGLDPAGPGFDSSKIGRLDSSDAEFVDIIHTSGLWAGFFGPCGHADFYPNKGIPNQPGCPMDFGKCSHIRAYKLFAESVVSTSFLSKKCDNWKQFIKGRCENKSETMMGEHVNLSSRGCFFLHTAGKAPYALGNNTSSYEEND